ncbi:cilia- and flagella-associated protein 184 [Rhynochetos jubatus]
MEAAAGRAELERPEGPAQQGELSPAAPGESPEPEVPSGAAEPEEPEKLRLGETEPPGPEVPSEPAEPEEPEKLWLGEAEPPGPEEPPEPEAAAGLPQPGRPEPCPSAAAPAAGSAGEEAASRRDGAAEEQDVADEGEEERQERAALLEQHRGLARERERLRQAIARLQLRLGQLLRLRRGEERPAERCAAGPQLYAQHLQQLRELSEQREREAAAFQERLAARQRANEERQARAQAEWAAFQAHKAAVTVFSLGRRLGSKEAAAKAVAHIQARERDKEEQVRKARVENIKLTHEIKALESSLKAQSELVEHQCFMDFERMKKENQKHSEKLDNLSDEILKLRKKVSNTVHTLSHFREKLQFVEAENQGRKAKLMDIESALSQKRDMLITKKQARDRLRKNNLELQHKCGLLGNEMLLRDFEEKVDTLELLNQRLEALKHHHADLILTCRRIQKKIQAANSSLLAQDN